MSSVRAVPLLVWSLRSAIRFLCPVFRRSRKQINKKSSVQVDSTFAALNQNARRAYLVDSERFSEL